MTSIQITSQDVFDKIDVEGKGTLTKAGIAKANGIMSTFTYRYM